MSWRDSRGGSSSSSGVLAAPVTKPKMIMLVTDLHGAVGKDQWTSGV